MLILNKLLPKTFFVGAIFLAFPFFVHAADVCSQNTNISFIARDPGGSYIANASVDVYKQEIDASGHAKPAVRVAGGTTDAVLGRANLSWRNSAVSTGTYAVRIRTVSKDNASFWFYGLTFSCGETTTVERTLSGILFTLHDADGNLLINTSFNVYSQLIDSSGSLLAAKDESLANLNSGSSGRAKIYLPQGSVRSIDGSKGDYYVLEISTNNIKSYFYNIHITDGQLTNLDYYLSSLRLHLMDAQNNSLTGVKVEIYKQELVSGLYQIGAKVGDFTTDDTGHGSFQLPGGLYTLGVKGTDNKYQYWDVSIRDGQTESYSYNLSQTFSSVGSCQKASNLNIVLRDFAGNPADGLKFEIYEQKVDTDGLPIAGNKMANGTLDSSGRATVSFKPEVQKSYALKVWDKRADRGDFWFFDAVRFVCNYDRTLTKNIPSLKVVLRDSQGELKRNYNFSLYTQDYDADGKPFFDSNALIANLKTDAGGQIRVYVAPYNPYRGGQTGSYAISAKDSGGNTAIVYDIKIPTDKDYVSNYTFSSLSGLLVDGRQRVQANREVKLYEVTADSFGRHLGSSLIKIKTDSNGRFNFEYPAGIYAIGVNDDFSQENIFWNISVKAGGDSQKLTLNLINFNLSDILGEGLPSEPTLKLYSLTGSNSQGYFRNREIGSIKLDSGKTALKSLAAGAYLVVYLGKGDREYGVAFNAVSGSFQNVNITVGSKYVVKTGQSFQISGSSSSAAPNSSGVSVSLAVRLKGRILLQVEDKGQAWYVNPSDGKKYYLGRPQDAYNLMRRVALGISNKDFAAVEKNPSAWRTLAGKILLKTEDNGRAYYFDPVNLKLYYLGRPSDAFNVMRTRGLGIKTSDLGQLPTGVN